MSGARLNTRLQWQGAEFLVLAHLLIEGIEAYKPYVNHPAYDLVAINAANGKMARISVKSRWATNRAGWFPLKSLDCHFVVHVALNRGVRQRKQLINAKPGKPTIYVFPVDICKQALSGSKKINIRNIRNYQGYEENWEQVQEFLNR
jgi:hypothetical protein